MSARFALYYAPEADDPLWRAGGDWLDAHPAITAEPRQYGFHATLKPPMRLAQGGDAETVSRAAAEVAAQVPAFDLPPLAVTEWHGFLCLRETTPSPSLQALADACVAGLDHLRAAPTEAELTRRRAAGLSRAQDANLLRWGYPHVFATWFFHMTLSGRLSPDAMAQWRPRAESFLAQALALPRRVTSLCVFEQPAPDARFHLATRLPLAD